MKLERLFENELPKGMASDFLLMRTVEYRNIAKELEIVLKSGKGFPGFTAKGAWFGFGIAPLGGDTAEEKNKEERMPFDMRVKAFLMKLARLLEKDLETFDIELTVGGNKKDRKKLEPGTVKDQLLKNFIYGDVPGGAYSKFAGKDQGVSGAWFIAPKDAK